MIPARASIVIIPSLIIVSALILSAGVLGRDQPAMADAVRQTPTALTLDVEVNGNAAVSMGPLDSCTGVAVGDEFPVDVLVQKVSSLVAWEVYLQYDRKRLEVVSVDIGNSSQDPLFLSTASNSNVINVSDPVPNRNGLYRLAAADIAIPAAPEQGSGLLARVTLKAKGDGFAALGLPHLDYNGDGTYDLGPRLITLQGKEIGDVNGDGFLDSLGNSGHVAIGASCEDLPADATPLPGTTGGPGAQPTGDPGTAPGETPGPPGSDGSGETPGAGVTPGAEASPGDDDDTSVTSIKDENGGPSGGDQNRTERSEGGFFKLWMLGPAAVLGLLGALFAFATIRRSGFGQ